MGKNSHEQRFLDDAWSLGLGFRVECAIQLDL